MMERNSLPRNGQGGCFHASKLEATPLKQRAEVKAQHPPRSHANA
jgi:hypothetical protein